jgi:hypothetical protein
MILGQVFYVIAAAINFFCLTISLMGLCMDVAKNKLAVPSFLLWALIISVVTQLIAISVYGGAGIGDQSFFEPDYSLIIACIVMFIDLFSALVFAVECVYFARQHL